MDRRSRLRWVLFAVVGAVLAILLGFVALPMALPAPVPVRAVVMDDYSATDVHTFNPDRPEIPAPAVQPVPTREDLPVEYGEHWDRAHDRADWIDGAVVTCDIGALMSPREPDPAPGDPDFDDFVMPQMAFLDMDEGVHLEGSVDVVSRFYTPVVDGRITFTVRETSGSSRVLAPDMATSPSGSLEGDWLQVRWSGAEPGTTVGCDGVWKRDTGTLTLTVLDERGQEFSPPDSEDGTQPPLIVVRGCGLMSPAAHEAELPVPAGRCALQVERRNSTFPLIANRGEAVIIDVPAGGNVDVTLRAPPEPPLYQPPDLIELSTAADVAAYFGSDAMADAFEELLQSILNGDWDPAMFEELAKAQQEPLPPEETFSGGDLSDPEVAAQVDSQIVENEQVIDFFATSVEAGETQLEDLPPETRAAVEAKLQERGR